MSEHPSLRICPATEVPEAALAAFYRAIDPAKGEFRSRHWRRIYRLDWSGSVSPPLVATSGDRVVGHAGLIPVKLRSAGEERLAHWFVDFWILPDQQRRGVGMQLTQAWMALCPLHVTFCNERSMGVFRKLGWKERRDTRLLRLPLHPERHPRLRGSRLALVVAPAGGALRLLLRGLCRAGATEPSPLRDDPALFAALRRPPTPSLGVPRTDEFLAWRLRDVPWAEDHLVFRVAGEGRPIAVARPVDTGGCRQLTLLTLSADPTDWRGVAALMSQVLHWATSSGIDEVMYMTSDPALARALRCWLPVQTHALFAYHANDVAGWDFLERAQPRWEALDSDVDLSRIPRVAATP